VLGILTQFDNTSPYTSGYQITLRYPTDVLRGDAADDVPSPVLAREFELVGAYPNPFNSTTQISFVVGTARTLDLTIFDLLGREVAATKLTGLTPGTHSWTWSPSGASGLYLLRVAGSSSVQTAKVLYLR